MKKYYYWYILVFILFCIGSGIYFYLTNGAYFLLAKNTPLKLRENFTYLVDKLNESRIKKEEKFTIYVANFIDDNKVTSPRNDGTVPILLLGSRGGLHLDEINKYKYIFASTPLLINFLKANKIDAFYLPMGNFSDNIAQNNSDKSLVGVIGNPPFVVDALSKRNIKFKMYSLDNVEEINNDLSSLKAIFAVDTAFVKNSLDLHPMFFKFAENKIPLFTHWNWPTNVENINLFNDAISFYMEEDDLNIILDNFTDSKEVKDRINSAYNLVRKYYSADAAVKRIKNVLENNIELDILPDDNSINMDVGVSVGHVGSGDFWLAKDIVNNLMEKGYTSSITFFNSLLKYKADINILIRGFLPISKGDYIGNYNIVYVAYPQFEQDEEREYVSDIDEYINRDVSIIKDTINAFITSSKILSDKLKDLGYNNVYFIPQFTNTDKFYPDFHKELQNDVLFVGMNSFYRKAWKYVYEAGLPITIYGPGYPDGISKGEYLDNRILRKYYSSAKIVLNDTRDGMKDYGVISNRIYDASASGSLVISDYMKEIEDIYGDSIPMWKSKEELIELVKYYLDPKNESERIEKANRAREITLKNFTADIFANKLNEIIIKVKNDKK
ncbi:MAG: glycosyltransferase [Alphaproteobacteria bacterium]|nr:glycosyltransferase [Alphaproteobacteria bacterium]